MARKKKTALSAPVPTSVTEAEVMLAKIGELDRQIIDIERRQNDRLANLKFEYESKAAPLRATGNALFEALHTWAEANRSTLLKPNQKTVKLGTGELSWRTTPPSVRVTKADVVIEQLKLARLHRMLRTKTDIDKNKILAEPDAVRDIKGISISQREEFVAKPFDSEIEKVQAVTVSKKQAG